MCKIMYKKRKKNAVTQSNRNELKLKTFGSTALLMDLRSRSDTIESAAESFSGSRRRQHSVANMIGALNRELNANGR